MTEEEKQTRERIRALVRDVLQNVPVQDEADEAVSESASSAASLAQAAVAPQKESPAPQLAKIHTLKVEAKEPAADERPTRDESAKTIITETDVRALPEDSRLIVAAGARLTPLAADLVRERRIELVRRQSRRAQVANGLTVAVGADHGGFEMKGELKKFLEELNCRIRDYGTNSTDAVDYPDFAHAVARAVADHEADVGIVIDGAGVGSAMTANKVPGVRAAACYSVAVAKNSREHNGANVLTLGSKTITNEQMREIVRAWLTTDLTEDRHRKRVAKIEAIEQQYKC